MIKVRKNVDNIQVVAATKVTGKGRSEGCFKAVGVVAYFLFLFRGSVLLLFLFAITKPCLCISSLALLCT